MRGILLNDNHGQILHIPYQSKDLLQIKILDGRRSKNGKEAKFKNQGLILETCQRRLKKF